MNCTDPFYSKANYAADAADEDGACCSCLMDFIQAWNAAIDQCIQEIEARVGSDALTRLVEESIRPLKTTYEIATEERRMRGN